MKTKDISIALLIFAMATYFGVAAVGRGNIDKAEIEVTKLRVEVLKLQLIELQPKSENDIKMEEWRELSEKLDQLVSYYERVLIHEWEDGNANAEEAN